ncbi:MFS transporter [Rhizobium lusitanum]|uniref:MFS transporter n=1 Tax=Rhizobium lusitanum TaxID=293958 RepID=UPI002574339F|nr:MFS transporter [Rhizobium lusitanum]
MYPSSIFLSSKRKASFSGFSQHFFFLGDRLVLLVTDDPAAGRPRTNRAGSRDLFCSIDGRILHRLAPFGAACKTGEHRALFLGLFIFAAGLLIAVLSALATDHYIPALSASVILQGLGQGIVLPLLLNKILSTISNEEAGMASGAFSTMQIAGSAFGVTIVGAVLFSMLERIGGKAVSADLAANVYREAFSIASIYNLIAVVLGLALLARIQTSRDQHP